MFEVYRAWEPGVATAHSPLAASIGRGEVLFETRTMSVANVPGLNGPHDSRQEPILATCSSCHNRRNVGSHDTVLFLDVGVTAPSAGDLDVENLPVYTFQTKDQKSTIQVTDPGRSLVTGRFADLGNQDPFPARARGARALLSQWVGA